MFIYDNKERIFIHIECELWMCGKVTKRNTKQTNIHNMHQADCYLKNTCSYVFVCITR